MGTAENKELVRAFYEAMNSRDAKAAAEFWADPSLNHGREVDRKSMERLFEDAVQLHERSEAKEMVAEGGWVACRVVVSGRHKIKTRLPLDGGIYNISDPDGRPFSFQHIHMFRVSRGKIVEHWANRDDLGAARQLGLDLKPV